MTVELRPLGVKCNIQCQYCYQNPQRDAGNIPKSYSLEKMKAAIEKEGSSFSLFGGEALLIPEEDLEKLWAWGFQKYGSNSIQSNGTLINDNHIRMFKQYQVSVGISIDGSGELNDVRWVGTLERTREATTKTEAAIERLCQEGIPPSLIVTLHRCNATKDKLPVMHDWFRYLESIGITSVRLHILEVENGSIQSKYALSTKENIEAFLSFANLEQELTTLKFDLFQDMRNLLLGQDNNTTCVWNACDPYTTRAVRGVEGNGQSSNCGRTNKDGIDFIKSNTEGFERYLALYYTPQEYGGCKGCRFFLMCKGQCPGTAIEGDWRNRTQDCEVWKELYRYVEAKLIDEGQIPISIRSNRRQLEQIFFNTWAEGRNTNLASVLQWLKQGQRSTLTLAQSSHGDHTDYGSVQ
ncbi:MAG: radical SAM protein [Symploca sp. SIO2D2]|nr:radical SAM protein [Symploca sp. SIO2D2]